MRRLARIVIATLFFGVTILYGLPAAAVLWGIVNVLGCVLLLDNIA